MKARLICRDIWLLVTRLKSGLVIEKKSLKSLEKSFCRTGYISNDNLFSPKQLVVNMFGTSSYLMTLHRRLIVFPANGQH